MAEIITPYVIPLSSQKPKNLTLVPSDPGSRYKTRQLQIQVVGKSKMIKTCLLNILDVAKDCQVPPSYIGTFMGHVIGAQAKFDAKKPERQQAYLSGEQDAKTLSKIMLSFINEVLLCPKCSLPEILITVENNEVMGNCRACGSHTKLNIQDEKFIRYVINHPPNQSKGAFAGNKASAKKDTSKAKDREEKDKDKEAEKPEEKPKVEKVKKVKTKDEDVVWFSDTSEEATRKRREEMLPDTVNITQDSTSKKIEDFVPVVKEALKDGVDALQQLKTKQAVDDKTFVTALFNAMFAADADLLAQLKANGKTFTKFVKSGAAQIALLSAIENFCGKVNTAQLSKVPLILKELYDQELVDEDNIFAWEKEKTDAVAAVREQAAPMLKWLKEAEEESDEEDE
eukprot:TRINITY_DN609_c0_g1_i1.p1 TRINITY_DN609_c0_g1~~TRINITY_DN609_c0_g1_i1.p1  ORF type:complete len:398 (-),score=174.74 TRINITY_DN609_c0_g1_i1:49-1242(-)